MLIIKIRNFLLCYCLIFINYVLLFYQYISMEETNPITSTVTEKQDNTEIPVKLPKKILHFSDGILEEFSDEDETDNEEKPNPIYDVNEVRM